LAQQFDVHPNQITQWKGQLLEGAAGVFGHGRVQAVPAPVDLKALHAKIGELALENDFLEGAGLAERKAASVLSPLIAAKATFALKAGVWFRRVRFVI
jgi:transposase